LEYARIVAKRYGTDHHEFIVKPDALSVLPELVRRYGEPFADASAVPSYYVARETRKHVTVALNGDGGDENFAGYLRYLPHRFYGMYDLLPPPIRHAAASAVGVLGLANASNTLVRRAAKFIRNGGRDPSERYLQWVCFFDPDAKSAIANDRLARSAGASFHSETLLYDAIREADGPEELDRLLAADVRTYLADDLMVKMDIASMANSLEARSPFLDHRLMELAAQIPADLKLRGTTTKYILKKALKPLLPDEILTRGKRGFGIPVDRWFRGELGPLLRDAVRPDEPALKTWF
ncbi:MAG: asparagine synthase C-terminal domain-containing protein, partial [bacterium]